MKRKSKFGIILLLTISVLLFFLHEPLVNATTSYPYMWDWTGTTEQNYDTKVPSVQADPFDQTTVVATAKYTTITAISEKLINGFAQNQISAVISLIECTPTVQVTTEQSMGPGPGGGQIPYTTYHHKLVLNAKIHFYTDKQIMPGQLDPGTVILLGQVVGYIIAGLVAAYAVLMISNWLKSMTTTTSTVTKYDANGHVIEVVTTTGPDWGSIALDLTILVTVALVGYMIFLGPRKKR